MTDAIALPDNTTLILVSNREPYEHGRTADGVEVRTPAGGLVSALDPILQHTKGVWVAWGSGAADAESADGDGRLMVPPEAPAYTLRRVWLDADDIDGYYHGFANSALWPLCHMLIQHLAYRTEYWERYKQVNLRFAQAVADEASRTNGRAMVWVQDYHFALLAEFLRATQPALFVHQFWHIPFPGPDIMRLLPVGVPGVLLRGLLGNDLLEFQTERHASNFLDCVTEFVSEAKVDRAEGVVTFRTRTISVDAFPISIDVQRYEEMARAEPAEREARVLRERYAIGDRKLGVCVDRVDYTKGIPERLHVLDTLWTEHPEFRGRFTFLFVATPSRSDLAAYQALEADVAGRVHDINARFGTEDWHPIVLISENVDADLLAAVYRAADLCLVSSLQDGMNLVAKEFIACQVDERGVLVLSEFAGAAEEMEGAVLINPFNVDGFVAGIREALEMSPDERERRMRRMRRQLGGATIFDWLGSILERASAMMDERAPAHS